MSELTRALVGTPEHPELVFRRSYQFPVDELRVACTQPERLERWFGRVEGWPSKVGDSYRAHLSDDADDVAEGRVLVCEPDRLQVSWSWQGEADSTITAHFVALDESSSQLRLHHELREPDHTAGYGGGWEQILGSLERALTGRPEGAEDAEVERAAASRWRSMADRRMVLERRMPAPVEQVWQRFASAEGLHGWWWSHWSDVTVQADVREGGSYRIEAPSQGVLLEGDYLTVDEPRRLAFTWVWSDVDGGSADEAVEIDFVPADDDPSGATILRVRHTGAWDDESNAENYRQGWEFTLGQLEQTL
ncbi:SRPBCC family protein [Aestuariimicrobium ganziense]|uniref:SRPBCC family protein n=1 Tax=Aestuariimicrobium ganziense TaxID=2773677 RepID=UPI0019428B95|nr:SRPBCC family protein [Aestuariimicrobium ganziense]